MLNLSKSIQIDTMCNVYKQKPRFKQILFYKYTKKKDTRSDNIDKTVQ